MSLPEPPPELLTERAAAETGFAFIPIRAFEIGLNLTEFRVFAQLCADAATSKETPEPMALALSCDVSVRAVDDAVKTFIDHGMLVIEGDEWELTEASKWH